MGSLRSLTELSLQVNREPSTHEALQLLCAGAVALTRSRNVLLARMNDELGAMILTHGAGKDISDEILGKLIKLGAKQGGGIVGYVAAKGASYVAANVDEEPLYQDLFSSSKSEVAIPIQDRFGRIRAVLNVESDQPDWYGEEEVDIAEGVAALAGHVIARAALRDQTDALIEISTAVEQATTEDELLEQLLRIADDKLRFTSCAIFLRSAADGSFVLRAATGILADRVGLVGYEPGDGLTGWVAREATPLRLNQPQTDPRWRGRLLEIPGEQIASYLAVPVISRGDCIGVVRVIRRASENPYHDNRFTEDDQRILGAIAEEVAYGLEGIRAMRRIISIERMAAWGELSAKSSHMIGNRVFAIQGDANEIGHLLGEPELDRKALQDVHGSLRVQISRLEEILQEFRDFVSATQLSKAPADFNAIVREAVEEVFPRRTPVRLVFRLTADLPQVVLDAAKFRRAVSEIVENSLNFVEEGELTVTTDWANAEVVAQARLDRSRKYVEVVIEDQGPGIEFERKNLIFTPFYSSRVKGMGLGLSIVKGILEAHGGQVIESGVQGKGARFVMLVPCQARP
ncbi:MAG: GAF domain-containing protein [Chthonomonas sp.]|nr:GAF domain-containing protein [Chthonomonas sp.]